MRGPRQNDLINVCLTLKVDKSVRSMRLLIRVTLDADHRPG